MFMNSFIYLEVRLDLCDLLILGCTRAAVIA